LYALGYPGSVRSVVLDGAVSFDDGFPREAAAHAQRAMDLLAGRCASDPACAAEFPSPQAELASLLARFDRGPVAAAVRHPRTGAPVTLTLHRNAVAEIVRVALYTPVDAARLLQIIRLGSRGDVAPLAAAFVHLSSMSTDEMALGLTMSVLCSEDMPRVAREDFTSSARGTFLGSAYADGWRARCRAWPSGPGPDVDVNAVSHAPALILSGQHDPVTPPSSGDAMARRFADHLHVTVPGAAHNASFTGCVPDLIAAFLDGRRADLDTSCAAAVPLPAIVPGSAGGRP
jgi:pimeloyl-ACP methyl ester carboxylesterase